MAGLLSAEAGGQLPPRVYTALVGQLFGTRPLINVIEALLVATIGGLATWRSGDPLLGSLTLATTAGILAMIPLRRHFAAQGILDRDLTQLRRFERAFERFSWTVSAGIGLMAARAILASEDTLVHLMVASLALGATSSNLRFHFRPRIAFGKTLAINAPLIVAVILVGDVYYLVLGLAALAATKLFLDICLQLYRGSVAVLMTVREKEQLASELEEANADLERRENERREAEAALKRLRAELTHVARLSAMGAMASTLAHELNQPLTAVINYVRGSRRLLEEPDGQTLAQIGEAMEAAESGALRAGQIIRRLRGLVYRGAVETRAEDMDELIAEACDLALVDAARLGVTRRVDLAAEARWATVDRVQIQQVLINLIRNAVEAMRESPRREIAIATRRAGDLVEISVADSGPGLADSDDTLFTPFRSTKSEGLGIGLSISRTIVEAHGGKIWADAGGSEGAVFRFTVPVATTPDLGETCARRAAS